MGLKGRYIYTILGAILLLMGCKDNGIRSLQGQGVSSLPSNIKIGEMLKAEDGTVLMNRVMSVSDPMRNPNWDWTKDKVDTLYITSYSEPKK